MRWNPSNSSWECNGVFLAQKCWGSFLFIPLLMNFFRTPLAINIGYLLRMVCYFFPQNPQKQSIAYFRTQMHFSFVLMCLDQNIHSAFHHKSYNGNTNDINNGLSFGCISFIYVWFCFILFVISNCLYRYFALRLESYRLYYARCI